MYVYINIYTYMNNHFVIEKTYEVPWNLSPGIIRESGVAENYVKVETVVSWAVVITVKFQVGVCTFFCNTCWQVNRGSHFIFYTEFILNSCSDCSNLAWWLTSGLQILIGWRRGVAPCCASMSAQIIGWENWESSASTPNRDGSSQLSSLLLKCHFNTVTPPTLLIAIRLWERRHGFGLQP